MSVIKGVCPECGEAIEIFTRGERQHPERSSCWWYFVVHKEKSAPVLCDGSGARV